MPQTLVNPATQPQAPYGVPTSPIASMLDQAVGAFGKRYPTPEEQAQIDYLRTKTAQGQQELSAPGTLQDVVNRIYNPQKTINNPDGTTGPAPVVPTDKLLSQNFPAIVGALANAGKYGDIANVYRAVTANAPGVTTRSGPNGQPSPVDMSMLGAGDSYNSTVGGMREHEALDTARELSKIKATAQYGMTGAIKDHNFKVQQIMQQQGVDEPTAEGIVDGVLTVETDPSTRNAFLVNKAKGTSMLLRSPAQGATGMTPMGGNTVAGAQGGQPGQPAQGAPADQDFLSTITQPGANGGLPGVGAPVGAPAAAATAPAGIPTLTKPTDLNINFEPLVGGPGTAGRLMGQIQSIGGGSSPENTDAIQQAARMKDLQSRLIGILGQRPGMRSNAFSQKLIAGRLPSTGVDITDPESWLQTAANDPQGAAKSTIDMFNEVMQNRDRDAQVLSDVDATVEQRSEARQRIMDTDKLVADFVSPEMASQYQKATGSRFMGAPAAAAPKTNLQQGVEATSPTAAMNGKVPTATEAAKLPVGSVFKDNSGNTWEIVPGAERYKMVQPGGK